MDSDLSTDAMTHSAATIDLVDRAFIAAAVRKLERPGRLAEFLNTMGKLLELVIARRITGLAEANNLLPDTQMGARKGRSAETALQLITEQVHTIWGLPGPKRVATLLSLDISGAFDNVSYKRLAHDLKMR